MTNETRNRIEAYKNALPEMKERVMAGAFLLIMSVMMLTSASFAWITLSRAPEAAGMQTTVAANGNLEIALAQGSTKDPAVAPEESQVGDSSAAEGQDIVKANVTWGNLVNVSDPTYGLSGIELRPALLSAYNRTEYPLNGATYGGDGRVVTTNDRYEFASYELVDGTDDQYYFAAGDKVNYGVRAISSVGYTNLSGNVTIDNFRNNTNQLYMDAQNYYSKIVAEDKNEVNTLDEASGVTCISALEGLVTVFAQDKINGMGLGHGDNVKTSCSPYLWYLYQMMLLLENALELEGKAILEMANWQAYVASGDAKTVDTFATIDAVLNDKELEDKGVNISTLASYKKSLSDLQYCINGLKPMAEKCKNPDAPEETYYWENISAYVNRLVEINTTTMNGIALKDASAKNALTLIKGGDVIVYKGALVDLERRLVSDQNRVQANVQVTVYTSITRDTTVKGTVYTDAYGEDPSYSVDVAYSDGLESGAKGDATAKDTYGLALDVWVRTNYPDAVLTLEGSAKYENQRATIVIEGTSYDLYTISVGEGDTQTEVDVYKKTVDNVDTWYYASSMSEVTESDLGSQTPKEKYVPVIVGYEGENRVWEDWRELLESGYIEQDATTQGAGSCFVFYADTPTEQAKIMEMLDAFNVAFMDQDGAILGTAKLNLDSAYANQGKVTVPLEVENGTDYTDESGMSHKGITRLTQNTPTMITAIVYLNGSKLQNENVLAEGELQGQLNIQFGTDSVLVAPDNEELQAQARTITASVTCNGETITNGTIDGPKDEGLEYKPEGYTAAVKLEIEGEQPERIRGFFVRVINSTQGTRGEEVDFSRNDDGTWSADFLLKNPGTYAFNTLIVDGVQYTLHDGTEQSGMNTYYKANRPYVRIQGLKVDSVSVGVAAGTHMTAETSMNFPVTVKLESAVTPKQVSAQFFNADNTKQYTAILTYDSNNKVWIGSADISSSDTYSLKYISVDGVTLDAPATGNYTLYLGLTARVSTTLSESAWEFPYTGPSQIDMITRIFDDSGEPIKNLSGVELTYNNIVSPAAMTWDAVAGYYKGVFNIIQPGELTFKSLKLGEAGTLYSVPTSPAFWAMSMAKPEYVSVDRGASTQTVIKDTLNATIDAEMLNAETASVYAVVEHKENNTDPATTYYVPATGTGNSRTFNLPKLDGMWTIKELLLQNVYDPDFNNGTGKWYAKPTSESTETPTYTTDVPAGEHFVLKTDELSTEVIATYEISLFYDSKLKESDFTVNLSGTKENPTGTLLQGYTPDVLRISLTDYKGRPINGLTGSGEDLSKSNTKVVISYDNNTDTEYGSYDGASVANIDVALNLNSEGTELTAEMPKMYHSGEYTATVYVDVAGKKETLDVNPKFTIATKKPTVTISSVSSNASTDRYYTTTNPSTQDGMLTGSYNKKIDEYSAVVYMYFKENSNRHDEAVTIKYPTVTLNLSGVPSGHSGVTMVFPNAANSASACTFSFGAGKTTASSSQTAGNRIGDGINGTIGAWYPDTYPTLYPAGKQTVDEISLKYGDLTLIVTLSDAVTINNPLYPPYVDFVDIKTIDNNFTGTTPSRIYSEDGETITLPGTQTWQETKQSADTSSLVDDLTGVTPTSTTYPKLAYRYKTSGVADYYRHWYKYTLTQNVYKTTTVALEWTVTNEIVEWTDGVNTYTPGQVITPNGSLTLTAVIDETHNGDEKSMTTNMIRTVVTNVNNDGEAKQGNWSNDPPSGYTAVSAIPTTSDTGWVIEK